MKSLSFLQPVHATLTRAKQILIFDVIALSIWALCFNSIASDSWDWGTYYSIMVWVYACIYFLMTILGIGIVSYVMVLLRKSVLINVFWGLLIASMLIVSTDLIISLIIHAPSGKAWFSELLSWLGIFLSSPILLFPNSLTMGILVYIAWKSGRLVKSESETISCQSCSMSNQSSK